MKHYFVAVKDRLTNESVVIGAMLDIAEVREIISFLERFNATDFLIIKGVEEIN